MKTLARDRRTLRVCACGWGCPGCLRVLCKTCARLLKIFARSPRGFCRGNAKKRSAKTLQNRPPNRPQIYQNGSQMRPGTPSGEGRERGGNKKTKKRKSSDRNGYLFGPPNRTFFCFWPPGAFRTSRQIVVSRCVPPLRAFSVFRPSRVPPCAPPGASGGPSETPPGP